MKPSPYILHLFISAALFTIGWHIYPTIANKINAYVLPHLNAADLLPSISFTEQLYFSTIMALSPFIQLAGHRLGLIQHNLAKFIFSMLIFAPAFLLAWIKIEFLKTQAAPTDVFGLIQSSTKAPFHIELTFAFGLVTGVLFFSLLFRFFLNKFFQKDLPDTNYNEPYKHLQP